MSSGLSSAATAEKYEAASASGTASTSWRRPLAPPSPSSALGASTTVAFGQHRGARRTGVALALAGCGVPDEVDVHDRTGRNGRRHLLRLDGDRELDGVGLLVGRPDRASRKQLTAADTTHQPELARESVVDPVVAGQVVRVREPDPVHHQVVLAERGPRPGIGDDRPDCDGVVGGGEHSRPDDHRDRDDQQPDPQPWITPAGGGSANGGRHRRCRPTTGPVTGVRVVVPDPETHDDMITPAT